jgi:rhamnosyltransferase subunit B
MPNEQRRFIFNPSGTPGDLHPYLAFGQELKRRGHEVWILANGMFRDLICRHGLSFYAVGDTIQLSDIRNHSDIHNPHRSWKIAMKWGAIGTMREVFKAIQELAIPDRTVLVSPPWSIGTRIARDALDLPLATCVLNPFLLRSTVRAPVTPGVPRIPGAPAWFRRFQFWIADSFVVEPLIGPEIREFLDELGLPATKRYMQQWWFSPDLVLGLFNKIYVPPQPDWPRSVELVGHTVWDPPGCPKTNERVIDFCQQGSPPICFVPGSVGPGSNDYYSIASQACRMLNRRGLILDKAGPDLKPTLPAWMLHACYAPLANVLPHCAAIVHSGCMGTSAQALLAAVPQVVRPRVNDQPDLAERLNQLGVATTLTCHFFQIDNLAAALHDALINPARRHRCREVQAIISKDNAVEAIANHLVNLNASVARRAAEKNLPVT